VAIPDATFLVWRYRRLRYSDANARIDGSTNYLAAVCLGRHIERDTLAGRVLRKA
jgi:fatty-acyl-CoA synthase